VMTDFEVRANNMATGISGARCRVAEFGYADDSPDEATSRLIGMFICWLTACEEARRQLTNPSASFKSDVINFLPSSDDPNWKIFIEPRPASTLRQRVESLWGIRIAFTHGDGDTDLIRDRTNKKFAQDAHLHIPGVAMRGTQLILSGCNLHTPIRTIVQVQAVLP
jgi:hypothetical protein